jgi:cob(I)alamin adenosyltransferase
MARVFIADSLLADLVLRLQRELFVVGAELATATQNSHKLRPGVTKVTAEMVEALEETIDDYVGRIRMPEEFIVPGESRGSSFLDFARTVIRRAERQTVAMDRAGMLSDREAVRYLNRLADLVFVLARYEEGQFRTLRSG